MACLLADDRDEAGEEIGRQGLAGAGRCSSREFAQWRVSDYSASSHAIHYVMRARRPRARAGR